MASSAPKQPDRTFDVTRMSAQDIAAEIARLMGEFEHARPPRPTASPVRPAPALEPLPSSPPSPATVTALPLRAMAPLAPQRRPHRVALPAVAVLVLILAAGSWATIRQFRSIAALNPQEVLVARPAMPNPAAAEYPPAAYAHWPADRNAPTRDEQATESLSSFSAMSSAEPIVAAGISPDEVFPGEVFLNERSATETPAAEIRAEPTLATTLAEDPLDESQVTPASRVVDAPTSPPLVPALKPVVAATQASVQVATPAPTPPEAAVGTLTALLQFIASAGDVSQPADPSTRRKSNAAKSRIVGDQDQRDASVLQVGLAGLSTAAPDTGNNNIGAGGASGNSAPAASSAAPRKAAPDDAGPSDPKAKAEDKAKAKDKDKAKDKSDGKVQGSGKDKGSGKEKGAGKDKAGAKGGGKGKDKDKAGGD